MMVAAGQVLNAGGNPYDRFQLYRVERALLHHQRLRLTPDHGIVRVGYPPFVYTLLRPLGSLPFTVGALCWLMLIAVLSVVGFLAALRYFGWRRRNLPLQLFLTSPPVLTEIYHANVLAVVFAAVAFSLLLLEYSAFASGALLALSWIKPQVGLPIVLMIVLFHAPRPSRVVGGFSAGTAIVLALTIVTSGWQSVIFWARGLTMYAHDVAPQHVVVAMSGLYVLWMPPSARLMVSVAGFLTAGVLTYMSYRKTRTTRTVPFESVAWLWVVWFLAAPYSHVNDEMLLTIPLLAVLGREGLALARSLPAIALILLCANPVPYVWILPGLLSAGFILLRSHDETLQEAAVLRGAILSLMLLSLLPFVLQLPVRKEPILLVATALCLFGETSRKTSDTLNGTRSVGRLLPNAWVGRAPPPE